MDYETIDNFKLSRLEIILNRLFNLELFKSKTGLNISDLGSISIFLVVVAVILGVGATIFESVGESVAISTANTSMTSETIGMVGTLAEFIPTIAIVAVAAIVIGIILVFFGRASGDIDEESNDEEPTDSEGYTSMNKFKVKEKEYINNYYKAEPDFDDAKKSVWDRIFKKRYKK